MITKDSHRPIAKESIKLVMQSDPTIVDKLCQEQSPRADPVDIVPSVSDEPHQLTKTVR